MVEERILERANAHFRAGEYQLALEAYRLAYIKYRAIRPLLLPNVDRTLEMIRRDDRLNRFGMPSNRRQRPGRYSVISMVRDEIDIIEPWLCHVLSLCDNVHVIDHQSSDGTRELLLEYAQRNSKLNLYLYDNPAYAQADLVNLIAGSCGPFSANDWLFFLDADEFLPAVNYDDLSTIMGAFSARDTHAVKLRWRNIVSLDLATSGTRRQTKMLLAPLRSSVYKVAFQPANYSEFSVDQGAHNLLSKDRIVDIPHERNPMGFLYHFPIRSFEQVAKKIHNGTSAYTALGSARKQKNGWHWNVLGDLLSGGIFDASLAMGCAYYYGEPEFGTRRAGVQELLGEGATYFSHLPILQTDCPALSALDVYPHPKVFLIGGSMPADANDDPGFFLRPALLSKADEPVVPAGDMSASSVRA
jgi:hypothetical protein